MFMCGNILIHFGDLASAKNKMYPTLRDQMERAGAWLTVAREMMRLMPWKGFLFF